MIEVCSYCRKEHETNPRGAFDVLGIPMKVCPDMPEDQIAFLPRVPLNELLKDAKPSGERWYTDNLVDHWPEIIE